MSLSFKDYLKNYDLFFAHLMGQEGDQEKNHAWAQLSFQPAGVPFLAENSPPDSLPALLTAGASWGATGIRPRLLRTYSLPQVISDVA